MENEQHQVIYLLLAIVHYVGVVEDNRLLLY